MISAAKKLLKFRFLFTTVFFIIGFVLWGTYPRQYQFTGSIFGTYYKVILYGGKFKVNQSLIQAKIDSELNQINQELSTYLDESDISLFNQLESNKRFKVSKNFYYLMKLSKRLYPMLNQAWEPTLLPLSHYYGFGDNVEAVLTKHDIKNRIGFKYIEVLPGGKIRKLKPNIKLDFSSIAKGYAVDQLIQLLSKSFNIKQAFVDIGGEIKVLGQKPGNKDWRVGIQSPFKGKSLEKVIAINNMSLATSGNYLNYTVIDNQSIGHILDPRSLESIDHGMKSISVMAKQCAIADALATALFVMGPKEAKDWLSDQTDYPAFLIYEVDDEIVYEFMNGFDRFLDPPVNSSF